MSIKHYFMLLIPILLIGCQQETNYIQFKGTLIEKTTRSPVAGCKVQFSDDAQMYGYAITDKDGVFNFIVEPPKKNRSYKLSMTWHESYPSKTIPIEPPLQKVYSYDQYVVYDKTNPHSFPSYDIGGYRYYFYKTLPNTYTWEQAKKVCQNLNAYGYDDWHLPSLDEAQGLGGALVYLFSSECEVVDAHYWTSTQLSGGAIYYINFRAKDEKVGVTQNSGYKLHVIPFRQEKL